MYVSLVQKRLHGRAGDQHPSRMYKYDLFVCKRLQKKNTHTAVYICEQISKISFPRKNIYTNIHIYIYFAFIVDVAAGCAPSPVPPPPQSLSSALIYLTDANELMQTMHAHIPRIFYSKEAPTRSAVAESTIYSNNKKNINIPLKFAQPCIISGHSPQACSENMNVLWAPSLFGGIMGMAPGLSWNYILLSNIVFHIIWPCISQLVKETILRDNHFPK